MSLVKNGDEVVSVGGAVDPRWEFQNGKWVERRDIICSATIITTMMAMSMKMMIMELLLSHKNSGNSASSSIVLQLTKVDHHHHRHRCDHPLLRFKSSLSDLFWNSFPMTIRTTESGCSWCAVTWSRPKMLELDTRLSRGTGDWSSLSSPSSSLSSSLSLGQSRPTGGKA